ncbi:hypothetical protein Amsp01_090170 [Amycolatopsis sp. NBRC 101858]|uniref:RICIN domain-containing protein n=1 Tax=Amycolatopsis sp. NBRC 101858 TaxID=3032200 RepID=UPI0024A2A2AD|nr:RICIN domain-containing protein [Amycolatopsis sp. NBRC 101858]GLY42994.1 hypothetical protein Amsp01_090170 [Amycolatopsis sp. NBRC 101858]
MKRSLIIATIVALAAVVSGSRVFAAPLATSSTFAASDVYHFNVAKKVNLPVRAADGSTRVATVYGPFNVRAVHSGKCLDVTGGPAATGDGAPVQQWTCLGAGQTNQMWYFADTGDGRTYDAIAVHSGKCLDVVGGTAAVGNGVRVQQWTCLGYAQSNQRWALYTQDSGATTSIVVQHSGKCLDVTGGTAAVADGTPVQQWTCLSNAQTNQRWYLSYA